EAAASLPSSVLTFAGAIVDAQLAVDGLWCRRRASRLWHHGDRSARTLVVAHRAPGAPVQVVFIAEARAQLSHGLLGACRVAPVALEAVAARQAALCFESRGVLIEAADHFIETLLTQGRIDGALTSFSCLRVIPDPQHVEGH